MSITDEDVLGDAAVKTWRDVSPATLRRISVDHALDIHDRIHRSYRSVYVSDAAGAQNGLYLYPDRDMAEMTLVHAMLAQFLIANGRNHEYLDDLDDGVPIVEGMHPDAATRAATGALDAEDYWWGYMAYAYPWFRKAFTIQKDVASVLGSAAMPDEAVRAHWLRAMAHAEVTTAKAATLPAWLDRGAVDDMAKHMRSAPKSAAAWQTAWARGVLDVIKSGDDAAEESASAVLGLVPGAGETLATEFSAYEAWVQKWTRDYVDSLPDAAFLYVEAGGRVVDGRTAPSSLRKFVVKDAEGNVDSVHLRHALSKLPGKDMPAAARRRVVERAKRLAAAAGISLTPKAMVVARKDEYQRLVTGAVLVPDVVDAHGDILAREEIESTAHDFLARYNDDTEIGVQHDEFSGGIELVESWVLRDDWAASEDDVYPAGTWMITVHVTNDETWQAVLDEQLTCFSPAGRAMAESLDET